jgi:arabinose-5-phosphate isomerase
LCSCKGRVVVTGMGKSGLIGRKIAATFACAGTPSFFLHPADAAHGDLGMITESDTLLLVSHSGATEELLQLLPYLDELGVPIVALVGRAGSPIAQAADVALCTHVEREVCPHNVIVTTSAIVALSLADALALAMMRYRNVSVADLRRRHPRGALGKRLTSRVSEAMQRDRLPLVDADLALNEALVIMAAQRSGLLIAVNGVGMPLGVVTEVELRQSLRDQPNLLGMTVRSIMAPGPVTLREDATLHAAEEKMRGLRLKSLVVVDAHNRVTGIVHASGES